MNKHFAIHAVDGCQQGLQIGAIFFWTLTWKAVPVNNQNADPEWRIQGPVHLAERVTLWN